MRVVNYGELIKESEEQLLTLERKQTKGILRRRVRFLRLLKSGACTTQAQAGRRIAVNQRQSQKLWKKYQEQGVKGFLVYPFTGHAERISEAQKQALDQKLRKDEIQSLKQGCAFLEQQGVHFSISGVHYIFKRLHIKKKTGRPTHHHRDHVGAEGFKKKFHH
jgi:hypothetical protein